MSTIDYLPLANGVGANVESQAQYLTDLAPGGTLENGYQTGLAKSVQMNKTLRQSSMMMAAQATYISDRLAVDVLDDGDLAALVVKLTDAIALYVAQGAGVTGQTIQGKLAELLSARSDFGAVIGNVTDATAALQAMITALTDSYTVRLVPPGIYRQTAALSVPTANPAIWGTALRGWSKTASRLNQVTAGQAGLVYTNVYAHPAYYNELRNLWLAGVAGSTIGIDMRACLDMLVENMLLTGWTTAIRIEDSWGQRILNTDVSSCENGILYSSSANSGPNGWYVLGGEYTAIDNRALDVYSAAGFLWAAVAEACQGGGLRFTTAGGAIHISAPAYFEENTDHATASEDVYVGSASYQPGFAIDTTYFNGRGALDQAAGVDYTPIRIKFAQSLIVHHNTLAVGNRWVTFEAGGNIVDSEFGLNGYQGAVDASDPRVFYTGLNAIPRFIDSGNRITDYRVIPTFGDNVYSGEGDFPYGGWVPTVGGAGSSFVRSANSLDGRPAATLTRTVNPASIKKTTVLSASTLSFMRGRFCTWSSKFKTDSILSTVNVDVTVDDGIDPITTTVGFAAADGVVPVNISHYIGAAALKYEVTVALSSGSVGGVSVDIATPMAWVGMDPVKGPCTDSGPSYWYAAAAPTTGTWKVRDRVDNSAPASGQPEYWRCTVAGAPGTWVAGPNLP